MRKLITALYLMFLSAGSFCQTLTDIESIEYDPIQGRFLVSNGNSVIHVNGDGVGVAVLPSPVAAAYGMEIMNNQLYAIHSNAVKVFDLANGSLLSTANISGANFLNGMASNGTNLVWVTDFGAKKIHQIDFTDMANPVISTLANNTTTTPNGIVYDQANNRLVFVAWGSSAPIKSLDLTTNTISTLITTNLANCDGIDMDGSGNYFVASWTPNRITKYNSDFSISEIITVSGGLSSAADICYATENDTLAIPNTGNNTVVYVGFNQNPIFTEEEYIAPFRVMNKLNQWEIVFENNSTEMISLSVLDMEGKKLSTEKYSFPLGQNRWVIPNENLSKGIYFIHLEQGMNYQSLKVPKNN
jgi:hypothetical protein